MKNYWTKVKGPIVLEADVELDEGGGSVLNPVTLILRLQMLHQHHENEASGEWVPRNIAKRTMDRELGGVA